MKCSGVTIAEILTLVLRHQGFHRPVYRSTAIYRQDGMDICRIFPRWNVNGNLNRLSTHALPPYCRTYGERERKKKWREREKNKRWKGYLPFSMKKKNDEKYPKIIKPSHHFIRIQKRSETSEWHRCDDEIQEFHLITFLSLSIFRPEVPLRREMPSFNLHRLQHTNKHKYVTLSIDANYPQKWQMRRSIRLLSAPAWCCWPATTHTPRRYANTTVIIIIIGMSRHHYVTNDFLILRTRKS